MPPLLRLLGPIAQRLIPLLPYLLIGSIIIGLYLRAEGWKDRATAEGSRADQAETTLARAVLDSNRKDEVISILASNTAAIEADRAALAEGQADLSRLASDRAATIRRLERDNETTRAWAAALLPDAVGRMRSRPAITGADDYRQWLRETGAVHAASEQPTQ